MWTSAEVARARPSGPDLGYSAASASSSAPEKVKPRGWVGAGCRGTGRASRSSDPAASITTPSLQQAPADRATGARSVLEQQSGQEGLPARRSAASSAVKAPLGDAIEHRVKTLARGGSRCGG